MTDPVVPVDAEPREPLDLDVVKRRAHQDYAHTPQWKTREDVTALIVEVERLRTLSSPAVPQPIFDDMKHQWLTWHVDQGHGITKREHYYECTCGATLWPTAPPSVPASALPSAKYELARRIVRFLRSNDLDGGTNLTTDEAVDRIVDIYFSALPSDQEKA